VKVRKSPNILAAAVTDGHINFMLSKVYFIVNRHRNVAIS